MANGNRPAGRAKRIGTSGGGNAARRGSGGFSGVGGGFSGGGSSGSSPAGNFGRGLFGSTRGGCLGRVGTLIIIIIVLSVLFRGGCSGLQLGGLNGDLLGGLTGSSEQTDTPSLDSLLGGTDDGSDGTGLDEAAETEQELDTSMFRAHEPDRTVSPSAREKYTQLSGDGSDTVTVMVYVCATDLESRAGMATADLNEMLKATLDDERVNLIVETGGTTQWRNNTIPSGKNMIYRVTSGGLETLVSNIGKRSMVEPDTLGTFIQFCAKNFPADRNILILWDHGGGSITGYGYDEQYPNASMTLDEIDQALSSGGTKFDCIGFDACLMATLETAVVAERYADYLLASEAVEPGTGWYYTNFLSRLSADTGMSTVDLGKIVADDFVAASQKASADSTATLSLIDLAELSGTLPEALGAFSSSTTQLIDENGYATVSGARGQARDFSTSVNINQIDLIHFAQNLGTDEAAALVDALRGAVKYNRSSQNITHANGVSIYFPSGRVSGVNTALNTYEKIGMDDAYADCVKSFASVSTVGQAASTGTGSPLDVLLGGSGTSSAGSDMLTALLSTLASSAGGSTGSGGSSSAGADLVSLLASSLRSGAYAAEGISDDDLAFLDENSVRAAATYLTENRLDAADLVVTEKNGQKVLALTEEQWSLVSTLEMNVFLDDGAGYIDLGLDNLVEYNDSGGLIMEYDGTWLALNGQIVPVYFVSQDTVGNETTITERIPALLNGERVEIMLVFDSESPYGRVLGASPQYDAALGTSAKGLIEIKEGDKLDFLGDYYSYDGEYQDTYYIGEQMTVSGELELWNLSVGSNKAVMTYRVTDIYGNSYWVDAD